VDYVDRPRLVHLEVIFNKPCFIKVSKKYEIPLHSNLAFSEAVASSAFHALVREKEIWPFCFSATKQKF
jgi:hypothetical protein